MKRIAWIASASLVLFAVAPYARTQEGERAPERTKEQTVQELLKKIEDLRQAVETIRREASRPDDVAVAEAAAAAEAGLPEDWVKSLDWRSLGPAGMGGRITEISVFEKDPSIYWVATASGGLLKTKNNGVTFEHQFDHEATVSLGAVCVAPSDESVVWVGTGENNPRNSVSYGDGVYKSTDGGKTWKNMGLEKSFQIGRIVVHPKDPDVVYVGALGRLYGPNEERGLFKTTDGGETWEKILYIDETTGVIDVEMHPKDPDTLIVSTWERQRDEFDSHRGEPSLEDGYNLYDPIRKWGPGSGLYKTTDGGKTFRKLTQGLPTSNLGRVDVDFFRKDPDVVYAIVDSEKIGMGTPPNRTFLGVRGEDGEGGAKLLAVTPNSPAAKAGLKEGDVVTSIDGKPIETYASLTETLREKKAGDVLAIEASRGGWTNQVEVTLRNRPLGAAMQPTSVYLGAQGEDAEEGALLTDVVDDSPAAKADLRVGDLVKSIDDQPLAGYEDLTELIRAKNVGDKLVFELSREGKVLEIPVTLGERPTPAFGGGRGGGRFGSGLGALLGATTEAADEGLRLDRLFDDRVAQKAGLEEGDVLLEMDGKAIADEEGLVEILRDKSDGDKVTFKVAREEETREVVVTLEAPGGGNRTRPYEFMYAGQQPNLGDRQGPDSHEYGGVYKSTDGGESWTRINSLNSRPMYFSQIRVDPNDDRYLWVLGVALHRSRDGGKTFTADGARRVHADHHAMWIDPRDGRHILLGTDGGYYSTYDRGTTWEHLNHVSIAQFYHVAVDTREPYHVYGGLQDNGSWGGPSRALSGGGPINADWISIGGGDGFVCRIDPFDPDIVYSESQNGAMGRRNLRTGERASIRPRPQRGVRYRFNWNTPFILSNHNPGIFYAGGNFVFRSVNRGEDLRVISPEIARTGRGTASALAESPLNPDLLWVGTDDGNLWITRDGGKVWTNLADKVGLPGPRWVATLEPSRFVEGRCYAAFDGHRSDDDDPHVYATEDFGETWTSIRADLPWGSTRCLREDVANPDLLYVGTEFALFVSLDRGEKWTKLNNNLPTVAVHEIAVHPTAGEIVAATHGRGLWILDVTPLRQMTMDALGALTHLYEPNTVVRWRSEPSRGIGGGHQQFTGTNPSRGAQLVYSLRREAKEIGIKILDHKGDTVRELRAEPKPGLHVVAWDLAGTTTRAPGAAAREAAGRRGARAEGAAFRRGGAQAGAPARTAGPPAGARGAQGPGGGGRAVPPGLYRVILTVDGREYAQTLRIERDPTLPPNLETEDDEDR